jgi:hypothetical protein
MWSSFAINSSFHAVEQIAALSAGRWRRFAVPSEVVGSDYQAGAKNQLAAARMPIWC